MTKVAYPMDQAQFFAALKSELVLGLREAGFNGSLPHFRRAHGDIIQTIWIQRNRHGGSCALNLGIHLKFLPIGWSGKAPDPKKITEPDCEFRRRLTPGSDLDHWWNYAEAPASAASLASTFFDRGLKHFDAFATIQAILAALDSEKPLNTALGATTKVRAALAAARIHANQGNFAECRRFAQFGLKEIEGKPFGSALRPDLTELSQKHG